MKRPEQHEIDTLARKQLANCLPPNLVLRTLSDDYGLDFDKHKLDIHVMVEDDLDEVSNET